MENAADIKAWCEEHWNDKGVINDRDRNVFVNGPGGIAIKAGSSPWYKSKEQKAYEARFGLYNKKLVPIILAEATKTGDTYRWPAHEKPAPVTSVPRKRVPKAKLEQAAAIIAKVPEDELAAFLAKFGLSMALAVNLVSLGDPTMIARQFLRATL